MVAARLVTFLVSAPRAVATAVPPVVALRSATSAARSDTLLATALRVVAMAVATALTVDAPRAATLAVELVTWPVTALKDRSATTVGFLPLRLSIAIYVLPVSNELYLKVVRLAMSPVTALLRLGVSVSATSASSPVTSRLLAPTKGVKETLLAGI